MDENTSDENNKVFQLGNRYKKWSKVFFVVALLYFIWAFVVVMGVYFFELGYRWSLLSINEWIYLGIGIFALFIVLEVIFLIHHTMAQKQQRAPGQPASLYYKGRRLHIFTYPAGSKGGIYSKTHIKIDDDNIVNVRVQMVPPANLWGKNEEK